MTRIEFANLRQELTDRLRALDGLAALPKAADATVVNVHFDAEPRSAAWSFDVNAATRPFLEALLAEEKVRLEALALGIKREVVS